MGFNFTNPSEHAEMLRITKTVRPIIKDLIVTNGAIADVSDITNRMVHAYKGGPELDVARKLDRLVDAACAARVAYREALIALNNAAADAVPLEAEAADNRWN